MRTETYTRNIYKFGELSETAKQHAKDRFAEVHGYSWSQEALESLQALTKHFDGSLSGYSVDWFNASYSGATFNMPDLEPEDIEERLGRLGSFDPETLKGHGSCILTGYCADEDAIDGFRKAFHDGERDLEKLMQAAFRTWLEAAQKDCEYQYSDGVFEETADANGWEFYENGRIV